MTASFKVEIAAKRGADSGALGVLDTLVHSFGAEGDFRIVVSDGKRTLGTTDIRVRKDGTESQIDIDLADLGGDSKADGCACKHADHVLRPDGFAVFYVSKGTQLYTVRAMGDDGKGPKSVWDSTAMTSGDVFATTLVRAGEYTVVNRLGKGQASLRVSEPGKDESVIRENVAAAVDVEADAIRPDLIKVALGQGVYFRASGAARVVIELAHEKEVRQDGPVWRLDRTRLAKGK